MSNENIKKNYYNTNWKQGLTKAGKVKFFCKRNDKWVNMGISEVGKKKLVWIIYNNDIIKKHDIKFEDDYEKLKEDVDKFIEKQAKGLLSDEDEEKAFEDMKPHEKLVEIGKRENIKYQKSKMNF
jgi:hypothetical protein